MELELDSKPLEPRNAWLWKKRLKGIAAIKSLRNRQ